MRPRIRSIKPELWAWEPVGRLDDQTRNLFVGLVTMADDEGRIRDLPPAILGHVFPYRRVTARRLETLLRAIELQGLVQRYTVAGERYVVIVGWSTDGHPLYQYVNRCTESRLPAPPSADVSPEQGVFLTEASVRTPGRIGSRIGSEGIGA